MAGAFGLVFPFVKVRAPGYSTNPEALCGGAGKALVFLARMLGQKHP